jgi:hypothetical protein
LWIALGLVVLPLAVSAVVLLIRVGSSFHAIADNAQNELHTRDVGRHLVMLGPYSRDGWNHLGPAMYYLLALPYRLTGSNSVGIYVGALLINAVAIAGMTIIAWRRGGLAVSLLTVLGLAVVMQNLGTEFLRDPWNPYVTVLPFGLLVFMVWELSAGRAWALPAAAAVATFLVQTHVGYVPLAIPLFFGGAVWLVVVARRRAHDGAGDALEWRQVMRAGLLTALVLVIMWTPPVIALIRHTPGNLGTATRYFVNGKGNHNLLDGYRVVAQQFSTGPEWVTGAHTPNIFSAEPDFLVHSPVPWLILPFAIAVWWLWRRRVGEGVRLAVIVAVASGLGVLAVSRTIGPIYFYRLRWTWLAVSPVTRPPTALPRNTASGPARRRSLAACGAAPAVAPGPALATRGLPPGGPHEPTGRPRGWSVPERSVITERQRVSRDARPVCAQEPLGGRARARPW